VTPQSETRQHESTIYYWPHEPLKALMGCLAMLAVTMALTIHFDVSVLSDPMTKGPFVGADLKPPADPSLQYPAARPEWYFLYLFQLLKFFPGESEFIGAIVIPTLVTTFILLAPLWGRWKIGHWANVAGFAALGVVMVLLSRMALQEDAKNTDYHAAVAKADADALRMHDLIQRRVALESGELSARGMISRDGAALLLRRDPFVRGPELFAKNCANCHTYYDPASPGSAADGAPTFVRTTEGPLGDDGRPKTEPILGGPNLFGFASREWVRGLLDPALISKEEFVAAEAPASGSEAKHGPSLRIEAPYFGSTAHKNGRMATWVQEHIAPVGAEVDTDTPMLQGDQVEAIAAALSAEAGLAYQRDADAKDKVRIEEGRRLIKSTCATHCHKFHDAGHVGLGPDLTGYGSYKWLVGMIADPSHPRFYGADNDRMPAFAADLEKAHKNALRWDEVATLADWLRRDFYRPEDDRPVDSSSPQQAMAAATVALSSVERLPRVEDFADPQAGEVARAEALFERNCSACHAFTDAAGQGIAAKVVSAPNLHGFASRAWLADFFDPEKMKGARFFGNTSHVEGDMVGFADSSFVDMDDETRAAYDAVVVALSAEAKLPSQADLDAEAEEAGTIEEGRTAIVEFSFGGGSCIDCHKFGDDGDVGAGAPDLTGYGSLDWLKRFVANPAAEEFYSDGNDRMPAFVRDDHPDLSLLSDADLELLLRWMRGELASPPEPAKTQSGKSAAE
jgi:ubiquinol-cytochrome c reductase cytochrome b subunit